MKQKSLKINALLNFFRCFTGLLFPLITFPYSSRVLMPDGIGRVNFAQSIISYFSIIAAIGIYSYGIREGAKLRDDKIKLSQFTKEVFTINMIATFVAYVLFAITIFLVQRFSEYRVLLCVCSSVILFNTIGMEWLYIAVENYTYITIRSFIVQVISVVLLFVFVKSPDDYLKYAGIAVLSSVGSNIMNFIQSRKLITIKTGLPLELKHHLKPIFILFATAVAVQVYTVLDTTMLGLFCSEWHVGIYSAATKVNRVVLSAILAIFATMVPRLSYFSGKEDKSEYNELLYKSLDFALIISVPCMVGLSLLSTSTILLLSGKEYVDAILPMRIMNPIIVIIGLNSFFSGQVFLPQNKERYTLYAVIIGAITNFILNFILIPLYQATGAAIATLSAESVVCAINLIFARKTLKPGFILKRLLIYCVNCVVMAIPVLCCVYFIHTQWVVLVCGTLSGAVTYFLMLLLEKNKLLISALDSVKNRLKLKKQVSESDKEEN